MRRDRHSATDSIDSRDARGRPRRRARCRRANATTRRRRARRATTTTRRRRSRSGTDARARRRRRVATTRCAAHVEALNAAFARHVARRRQRRRASFCARRVGITSRTRTRSRPSSRTRRGSEDEGKRAEARARGEVYVWGQGDSAQLGLGGDVDERRRPTRVTTGAMGEASATRNRGGRDAHVGVDERRRVLQLGEQR